MKLCKRRVTFFLIVLYKEQKKKTTIDNEIILSHKQTKKITNMSSKNIGNI